MCVLRVCVLRVERDRHMVIKISVFVLLLVKFVLLRGGGGFEYVQHKKKLRIYLVLLID